MTRTTRSTVRACATTTLASAALLALPAMSDAVPQVVQSQDTPHCDVLMPLSLVDELGHPSVFPFGERIDAVSTFTQQAACPSHDNPNIPNVVVQMTNLNPFTFFDLHYVADPNTPGAIGTSISNEDGLVNAGQAFRIDRVGLNQPLLGESILNDGLFQPGETWRFIIDDYVNTAGIPAHAFLSIGVGSASGGPPSSGSIIALIPEPASMGVLALALPALVRRRRVSRA
jgi:MYXO-CTERM domain-containing protein